MIEEIKITLEQSKKLIYVCTNSVSKFNNTRISQRDIAYENIKIA